ncbi:MAG: hypothetical protein HY562_10290 [Ignavibacteriales bacterium]|nr:hypothetical protein [Ignavibacteriales bacterium]
MKGIHNRQKLTVKPKESVQKYLRQTAKLRLPAQRRLEKRRRLLRIKQR